MSNTETYDATKRIPPGGGNCNAFDDCDGY